MLISKFCLIGVVCLCPGAVYMYKSMEKYVLNQSSKRFSFKLATNGQSDKAFLMTSKFCPQRVVRPCPGAIYMYKIIKKCLYKIRLQRDIFETCNKWPKEQEVSVDIKILSPRGCLAPGLLICIKSEEKNVYKIRHQRDFFETFSKWLTCQ